MNYITVNKATKKIIGIQLRTTNENFQCMQDIPQLWQKFFAENIQAKIPNKINDNLLAVYNEYESDYTKPYSYLIGCEVSSLDNLPEGMIAIDIPAAQYAVFTAKGKLPDAIGATWHEIWNTDLNRTYLTDFEIYNEKSANPENGEVEIFISIK